MIDDSKKRLLGILDALPFAAFMIGQDHKIFHWNKSLESLTGLKAEEMLGTKQHWKAFYKSVRPCLADLLVDSKVEEIQNYYAGKYTKSDLLDDAYEITEFFPELGDKGKWLRFTATVVRDYFGAIVGAVETLEDITEHKQSYRELNLLRKLTLGIIKTPDFHSAIEFVLRSVCEATNWACGEVWIPGDNGAALECFPVWYSSSPDKMKKFRQVSEEIRFPANTGLPGRVWSSRQHEWISDTSISSKKIFLRARVAAKTGLKAALGIPIIAGEDFLGVLVFYDFRTCQEDDHQVDLVLAVAAQLGEVTQRKYAENALLESEARLKKAEHMAQIGYWELDLVKDTLLWSDEVYRIFGIKPQEFRATYESFLDNIHPDDRQFVDKAYTDSLKDRTTYDIVHRLMLKDGTLKYVNEHCETIFDENGTPLRSMGTIQDITERVQAEELINHLNLVLSAIRNVNQLIVREKDRDDLIQQACAALIETGGYSTAWIALFDASGGFLTGAEAGFGKSFTSLLAQIKRGDLPACIRKALAKAGLVEIADPPSICADCPLMGIYSDDGRMAIRLEHDGEIYGVLAVSMLAKFLAVEKEHALLQEIADDIAFALYSIKLEEKDKQAVQKLRSSADYQKTIFETTSLATAIIEEDTTLSMINKEFVKLSGYSKEELEDKMSWTKFVAEEDLKRMQEYHNQRRIDPDTTLKQYEFRFINREGFIRDILLYVDLIPGTKKSVASLLDITERVQAEQEIEMLLALNRQADAEASLDDLMFFIAGQIVEVIPSAETSSIFFYNEERKVVEVQAWAGFTDSEIKGLEFSIEDSQVGRIFKPTLINDVSGSPDFKPIDKPSLISVKSQIAVPLMFKRRVIGIIYADNITKTDAFSQKSLDLLESIGNQLSGVIENTRLLEKVKESEEQYHSVVEDSPGLINRFTPDGTITFVNYEYCKFFGKKPEELIGMNIQSTIVEEDREKVMSSIISLTEESPVRTFENKIIRHDGKIRWIRWTDRALFDDKGQVTSCQSFGEDITDMKEAQEAIWQEKDKAQKYLDISEVIMLVLNKKGEITLINQKGNRILGYQEDELIGMNWFETCLPERNRKEIKQVFNKIMAGSTDFIEHHENPVLTRSGEKRIIAWHNTVLRDEKGNSIGILSSGEDITNRVRAEHLMKALNRASAAMGKSLTHEEIFNAVAVELKQLDISCMLFPLDETQDKLITKYISYESALLNAAEKLVGIEHKDYSFPIDAVDICREVVRDKKTLFMDDSEQTLRQILPKLTKKILVQITNILRVQKNITAPLIIEGQVIGVFSVQSETLAREDIPTATAFADQLSSAWNKIKLLQNLRKTVEGTIHTIAATVEARDPYTAGHQTRVADLAAAIASEMHLSKNQVEGIRMAGIIHDLGKINIPAEILSKPGKISEIEYKIIQTHPQVGFDLLKEIEFPWPIALMVHQHHEKMDGSGYPQGLKGEEILLEARILAVADTVEAMSSHRPYRPAYGIEKALEQIRHDKGTLLDPKVVDACLKVFEDGYKLPEG